MYLVEPENGKPFIVNSWESVIESCDLSKARVSFRMPFGWLVVS